MDFRTALLLARQQLGTNQEVIMTIEEMKISSYTQEVNTNSYMQFCYVPAGPFWMGSDEYDNEKPQHLNRSIGYNYWISRYPVTVAEFHEFVNQAGYKPENSNALKDPFNRPVRYVTWYESIKFCEWLTQKWQQAGHLPKDWRIKLPSEAEWEKAARGGLEIPARAIIRPINEASFDGSPNLKLEKNPEPKRSYPWGDESNPNFANYDEANIGSTSVVGCFPNGSSPYGCEEMSGNVWEWCRTKWYENYDTKADNDLKGNRARVLRGGAFSFDVRFVRCAYRVGYYPLNRFVNVGFRVVASL